MAALRILAVLATLAAAAAFRTDPSLAAVPQGGHRSADVVLGSTTAAVLARLGVPETASATTSTLTFGYKDSHGRLHESAVVFHADIAVFLDPELQAFANQKVPSLDRLYLGQPVAEVVLRRGTPAAVVPGDGPAVELRYPKETVVVAHGRVIAVGG